eukprot:scaffold2.g7457.t1
MAAAAADHTGGLTKRLVLDELTHTQSVDVEELIKAMRSPSVQGFQTALGLLQASNQERCSTVLEAAREQAEAVGEADLRRFKRQFSSLKNTFLHYEVKDEFISALAEGLPNGTEAAQLAQFEAEVAKNVDALRALKAGNEATQAAIVELVAQISASQEAFERQRASAAADLARLARDVAQHEADMGAPLPEVESAGEGGDDDAVAPALEAAGAEVRALEAAVAAAQAEAAQLEAAIAEDRGEVEVLRAHLAALEAATAAEGEKVETNGRAVAAGAWADAMAALTTALSGVSLLHAEPGGGRLHLKLLTSYPAGPVAGQELGPCATGDHELSITLAPAAGDGGAPGAGCGVVAAAELHPADVEVTEAVEGARAARAGPALLVGEVQAALGRLLHWRALAAEAGARFRVLASDEEQGTLRAALGQGVEAEVRLVQGWPAGEDVVAVVAVSGTADAGKAERAAALRLRGRGLLQALEAVQRELA